MITGRHRAALEAIERVEEYMDALVTLRSRLGAGDEELPGGMRELLDKAFGDLGDEVVDATIVGIAWAQQLVMRGTANELLDLAAGLLKTLRVNMPMMARRREEQL